MMFIFFQLSRIELFSQTHGDNANKSNRTLLLNKLPVAI